MIKWEAKKLCTKRNFVQEVNFLSDHSYCLDVARYSATQKRIPSFPIMALPSMAKDVLPQTHNALVNPKKIFESK